MQWDSHLCKHERSLESYILSLKRFESHIVIKRVSPEEGKNRSAMYSKPGLDIKFCRQQGKGSFRIRLCTEMWAKPSLLWHWSQFPNIVHFLPLKILIYFLKCSLLRLRLGFWNVFPHNLCKRKICFLPKWGILILKWSIFYNHISVPYWKVRLLVIYFPL